MKYKMEPFIPVNGSAGNSAPVGGKRRKLKLVTRKKARKVLKKLGLKMRGGEGAPSDAVAMPEKTLQAGGEAAAAAAAPSVPAGGKRKTKKRSASRRHSVFGL